MQLAELGRSASPGAPVMRSAPICVLGTLGNAVPDECDIADGTSSDFNGNGVPDECECLAGIRGDGSVRTLDLHLLLASWGDNPGRSGGPLDEKPAWC